MKTEDEYAILDEEGIALEAGELYWGSITTNDTQAIAGENKEVSDDSAIEDVMKSDSEGLDENQEEDEFVVVEDDADDLDAEDDDEADQEDAASEEEEDL